MEIETAMSQIDPILAHSGNVWVKTTYDDKRHIYMKTFKHPNQQPYSPYQIVKRRGGWKAYRSGRIHLNIGTENEWDRPELVINTERSTWKSQYNVNKATHNAAVKRGE